MKFVNLGYGNSVEIQRIVSISNPDSKPLQDRIKQAEVEGKLLDLSQGRPIRSMIVLSNGEVMLTAINPETVKDRIEKALKN